MPSIIEQLNGDKNFLQLTPQQKRQAVGEILRSDPNYALLDAQSQARAMNSIQSEFPDDALPTHGVRLGGLSGDLLGVPYKWGGQSPKTGFDCSGFTSYLYGKAGVKIPRTAREQYAAGQPTDPDTPGALLFYQGTQKALGPGVASHVAVVWKDNQGHSLVVQASPKTGVHAIPFDEWVNSPFHQKHFIGARSFYGNLKEQNPQAAQQYNAQVQKASRGLVPGIAGAVPSASPAPLAAARADLGSVVGAGAQSQQPAYMQPADNEKTLQGYTDTWLNPESRTFKGEDHKPYEDLQILKNIREQVRSKWLDDKGYKEPGKTALLRAAFFLGGTGDPRDIAKRAIEEGLAEKGAQAARERQWDAAHGQQIGAINQLETVRSQINGIMNGVGNQADLPDLVAREKALMAQQKGALAAQERIAPGADPLSAALAGIHPASPIAPHTPLGAAMERVGQLGGGKGVGVQSEQVPGAAGAAFRFGAGLTTPSNAALMLATSGAGPMAAKGLAALFAAGAAPDIIERWKQGDHEGAITEAALASLPLWGHHAVRLAQSSPQLLRSAGYNIARGTTISFKDANGEWVEGKLGDKITTPGKEGRVVYTRQGKTTIRDDEWFIQPRFKPAKRGAPVAEETGVVPLGAERPSEQPTPPAAPPSSANAAPVEYSVKTEKGQETVPFQATHEIIRANGEAIPVMRRGTSSRGRPIFVAQGEGGKERVVPFRDSAPPRPINPPQTTARPTYRVKADGSIIDQSGQQVGTTGQGGIQSTVTPEGRRFSRTEPDAEHPWLVQAKQEFGLTDDKYEAGFIAPDGSMLDLSDKRNSGDYVMQNGRYVPKPGRRNGTWLRTEDHREITAIIEGLPGDDSTSKMHSFMQQTGAIRVHNSTTGDTFVDLTAKPTPQQIERIVKNHISDGKPGSFDIEVTTPATDKDPDGILYSNSVDGPATAAQIRRELNRAAQVIDNPDLAKQFEEHRFARAETGQSGGNMVRSQGSEYGPGVRRVKGNAIWLTSEGHQFLTQAQGQVGINNEPLWAGVTEDHPIEMRKQLAQLVGIARGTVTGWSPAARPIAASIARAFATASEGLSRPARFVAATPYIPMSERIQTRRHEGAHIAISEQTEPGQDRLAGEEIRVLVSQREYTAISQHMQEIGYHATEVPEEIIAHLVSGKNAGLSKDRAQQVLKSLVEAGVKAHGVRRLDVYTELHRGNRGIVDEIRQRYAGVHSGLSSANTEAATGVLGEAVPGAPQGYGDGVPGDIAGSNAGKPGGIRENAPDTGSDAIGQPEAGRFRRLDRTDTGRPDAGGEDVLRGERQADREQAQAIVARVSRDGTRVDPPAENSWLLPDGRFTQSLRSHGQTHDLCARNFYRVTQGLDVKPPILARSRFMREGGLVRVQNVRDTFCVEIATTPTPEQVRAIQTYAGLGDFVYEFTDKNGSEIVGGNSLRDFSRDLAMFKEGNDEASPVSDQSEGVYEAQRRYQRGFIATDKAEFADTPFIDYKKGPEPAQLSVEDLLDDNGNSPSVFPICADRTRLGKYTPIDAQRFPVDYDLLGGPEFGLNPHYYGRVAWALSKKGAPVASQFTKAAARSGGKAVVVLQSPNAVGGSQAYAELYALETKQRMEAGVISAENMTRALRIALVGLRSYCAKSKQKPLLNCVPKIDRAIATCTIFDDYMQFISNLPFDVRNNALRKLGSFANARNLGVVRFDKVRDGMVDPRWKSGIRVPTGSAVAMLRISPTPAKAAGELGLEEHGSFPIKMEGIYLGAFPTPIPKEELFGEFYEQEGIVPSQRWNALFYGHRPSGGRVVTRIPQSVLDRIQRETDAYKAQMDARAASEVDRGSDPRNGYAGGRIDNAGGNRGARGVGSEVLGTSSGTPAQEGIAASGAAGQGGTSDLGSSGSGVAPQSGRRYSRVEPSAPGEEEDPFANTPDATAESFPSKPANPHDPLPGVTGEQSGKLPSVGDTVNAVRRAGLLTSPSLPARVNTSFAVNQATGELERIPAALADIALSAIAQSDRTTLGPSLATIGKATQAAVTTGMKQAWNILRRGSPGVEVKSNAEAIINDFWARKFNSKSQVINAYVNMVGRWIVGVHWPARIYALTLSLREQARLIAANEAKLNKMDAAWQKQRAEHLYDNPTETMAVIAVKDAETALFLNTNKVIDVANYARSKSAGARFVTDFLVPISRVPTNLVLRVLDCAIGSPVKAVVSAPGVVRSARAAGEYREVASQAESSSVRSQAALLAAKAFSPEDQQEFARAFGRGMIGPAIITLGAILAAKGLLRGTAPRRDKDVEQAGGAMPGSVLLGGQWVPIAEIAPQGTMLVLGATIYELFREAQLQKEKAQVAAKKRGGEGPGDQPVEDLAEATAKALWKSAAEIPYLKDTELLGEPSKFAQQAIASMVPSAVGAVARGTDPYQRRQEGLLGPAQSRIPGLRQQLPVRRDAFGEPLPQKGGIVNPFLGAPDRSGDKAVQMLRSSGATITDFNRRAGESDADFEARQQVVGILRRRVIEKLADNVAFKRLPSKQQVEVIHRLTEAMAKPFASIPSGKWGPILDRIKRMR